MVQVRTNGSASPGDGYYNGIFQADGQQQPPTGPRSFSGAAPLIADQVSHHRFNSSSASEPDLFIGREIRGLRRSHGWTQKYLAGLVGITGAQLHRYEVGSTRVSHKRLLALSDALGVSPDRLVSSHQPIPSVSSGPIADMGSGEDLLALIEVFSQITDRKSRTAVVAIARILAAQRTAPIEDE